MMNADDADEATVLAVMMPWVQWDSTNGNLQIGEQLPRFQQLASGLTWAPAQRLSLHYYSPFSTRLDAVTIHTTTTTIAPSTYARGGKKAFKAKREKKKTSFSWKEGRANEKK
jgi:hypothetical protein